MKRSMVAPSVGGHLDKLIDHCPAFARALDDYQAAFDAGNAEAAAIAWERATNAAAAFRRKVVRLERENA